MIKAQYIDREAIDCRSSGDQRKRVDAYFVAYLCPADDINPREASHEWFCRFEVPRGSKFTMQDFPDKESALAARGFTI